MKTKKLPSELSEEELLQHAFSEESKETIKETPNNIVNFLLYYKINPGAFPVHGRILFKLYKQHTKEQETKQKFFMELNNYIPCTNGIYFINRQSLEIGNKTFELLKKKQKIRKSPVNLRHFKNFIACAGIKAGGHYVSIQSLHKEYQIWAISVGRKKPMSLMTFSMFFNLFFKKHKIINNKKYIGIKRAKKEKNLVA